MKKMLLFEIRRNLLALVVFCVAAVAVSVVSVLTSDLSYHFIEPESIDLRNAGIGTFTAILCILCSVVPVMQFSYRMKMNSADLYYSLPVGRVNLMFARGLIGLFLVFVPYTLAYWLGVACVAMREPHFAFLWHLVYFVVSVPLGRGAVRRHCLPVHARQHRPGRHRLCGALVMPAAADRHVFCPESLCRRRSGHA